MFTVPRFADGIDDDWEWVDIFAFIFEIMPNSIPVIKADATNPIHVLKLIKIVDQE